MIFDKKSKIYYHKKMNNKKTKIIPLGQNCMPRTILTRWGVKPKKILGEKTYPFDLAVFETREITKSLKNDFEEFFYNLNYRKDKQIWVKEPDCIEFVHDKQFKENDKEKLIKKYLERIENFKQAIISENPILFVQILGDCSDIGNLYNELKRIRGNKPFRFVVVDTLNIIEKEVFGIDILKLSYPNSEYKENWWRKEFYSSDEGIAFEKQIAEFCLKILK